MRPFNNQRNNIPPDNIQEFSYVNFYRITETLFIFRLVLDGKMGKQTPKSSSRFEVLKKFLTNSVAIISLLKPVCD